MKALRTLVVVALACASIDLAFAQTSDNLHLTLPPSLYAVPGVPMSLYYDNVVLTEKPEAYRFEVTCDVGKCEERRWTITPDNKDVGDHLVSVSVKDKEGKQIERAKMVLHIVPQNAGANGSLRLLIVGDSLTHATTYPNEIARLLSAPGNPKWTMLGTHKPASAKPDVAHEGYGGWTWAAFLSKYDKKLGHKLNEKGARQSSPFVYEGQDGKPTLDIARYIREECGGQPPDVVTVLLGINDCFRVNPDDQKAVDARIAETLDSAEKFLKAFHDASRRTVFAVGLTTPPNARESGFEANYKGKYHRWGWKRIQHRLVKTMIERFSNRERDLVFLVPTEINLDPFDGYPDNNGVHPNAVGYNQIGDSFYCWMKWWLNKK